ncbi:unnamed protein product [Sphenostylis stenocarpa]|uniref:TMV resistance protein N-like n=1 Tax=Sphenostylis stenocarpa TaxID=92480 RepID=A0AA86SMB6_9FABA|nr:unnamed protein product [Sphenostylis stenocarpa]
MLPFSYARAESKLLKDIVEDVLQKLAPMYPKCHKGLVGIEENYEKIESLLNVESYEAKILGIWGMGGVGKSTLARALYDKQSHEFAGHCFLENVREESDKHGVKALRNRLFSELGKQIDHATNILEAFDFSATSGIEVLLDIVLITISGGDQLEMHDLIQEMGWEVVHQECIKDPGKQSVEHSRT